MSDTRMKGLTAAAVSEIYAAADAVRAGDLKGATIYLERATTVMKMINKEATALKHDWGPCDQITTRAWSKCVKCGRTWGEIDVMAGGDEEPPERGCSKP